MCRSSNSMSSVGEGWEIREAVKSITHSFKICFAINILFSELISWQTPVLSELCVYVCARCVGVQLKGETDFLAESITSPSNEQRLLQVVPKATAIPQTNPKTQPHTHQRREERGRGRNSLHNFSSTTFKCLLTHSDNLRNFSYTQSNIVHKVSLFLYILIHFFFQEPWIQSHTV